MAFEIGDIVGLKSGGPAMTVSRVATGMDGKIIVWCEWFGDTGGTIPTTHGFAAEMLEIVLPPVEDDAP